MPFDVNDQHLFEFEWFVGPDGYHFSDFEIIANGDELTQYRPLVVAPTVHRVMSELPNTETGATDFANQFGLLGSGLDFWKATDKAIENYPIEPTTIKDTRSESYECFEETLLLTKRLASLIDKKQKNWRSDFVYEINSARMDLSLIMTDEAERTSYSFAPHSLRDFIILMFAEEATGARGFNKCKQCGTWFPVGASPRGTAEKGGIRFRRRDSETCSDRCRVQFSRDHLKKRK